MDASKLIDLAIGYAWPLVTLLGLFAFRKPLGRLMLAVADGIGKGRSLKIGVASVSVELGATTTEKEDRTARVTEIQFAAEPGMFASAGNDYINALIQGPPVEAATIDLQAGNGKGFITSRLYLTAKLMARQRDLRVLAFVHTDGVSEGVYAGACLVDDLIRAIVNRFPEYDAAFALAVHQGWWMQNNPPAVAIQGQWPLPPTAPTAIPTLDARARFPAADAARVVGGFLQSLQTMGPVPAGPVPAGWVLASSTGLLERGEWVTRDWLRQAVGAALFEDRVLKAPDIAATVAMCRGPYVGLVDEDDCLDELISRHRLLEQIARAAFAPTNGK